MRLLKSSTTLHFLKKILHNGPSIFWCVFFFFFFFKVTIHLPCNHVCILLTWKKIQLDQNATAKRDRSLCLCFLGGSEEVNTRRRSYLPKHQKGRVVTLSSRSDLKCLSGYLLATVHFVAQTRLSVGSERGPSTFELEKEPSQNLFMTGPRSQHSYCNQICSNKS